MFEIIPTKEWYKWWDKIPREQRQRIIKKMHELKEDKQKEDKQKEILTSASHPRND
jgi:mRNA-degrading endonuclease RelE of RelBE toxin-antitoxin system